MTEPDTVNLLPDCPIVPLSILPVNVADVNDVTYALVIVTLLLVTSVTVYVPLYPVGTIPLIITSLPTL